MEGLTGSDRVGFGQTDYLVDIIDLFMLRTCTDLQLSALDCPQVKKIEVLKMFFLPIRSYPQ